MPDCIFRSACAADAPALLAFGEALLGETDLLARGPGERAASVDDMVGVIDTFAGLDGHLLLNAWIDGRPVAEIAVMGGRTRRSRHAATLGLGVLRAYWRRGIGRRLLAAAEEFAIESDIHRLELTVMAHNEAARALYSRAGFIVEGTKRHSLQVDGRYVDELLMAKLL